MSSQSSNTTITQQQGKAPYDPNIPDPVPVTTLTQKSPLLEFASKWGQSPYPAWAFSTALLGSFAARPHVEITTDPTTGHMMNSRFKTHPVLKAYPTTAHTMIFSSFVALGGIMCFDKDPVNGSAVVGVWSLLYALTNFKKSMWNFQLYPKTLTTLALVNSAFYSAKYLNFI